VKSKTTDGENYWEKEDFWTNPDGGLLDDASITAVVEKTLKKIEERGTKKKDKERKRKSVSEELVEIAMGEIELLFVDQFKVPYCSFRTEDTRQVWPVKSKAFKRWICGLLWEKEKRAVYSEALTSALNVLEAQAIYGSKKQVRLWNRVAWHNGDIYYDLTNEKWQAVRIGKTGWEVIDEPPILFRRFTHHKPQIEPQKGGNLKDFLNFVNIKDEDVQILTLVWLVTCFIPDIAHPILILHGPQGSAKTTFLKLCRLIIDPSETPLLTIPKDITGLIQILAHHYCSFFDNLSVLPDYVSDTLSRGCTGDGFSKRQLYTDDDDVLYSYKRVIGVNGINLPALKPDLLDRSIIIELERIPASNRKEEIALCKEFEEKLPFILGGIFDTLSQAIQIYDKTHLPLLPRLADFARWGFAISEALGTGGEKFLSAYFKNRNYQHYQIVENNPLALALMNFMEDQDHWEGTSSELLNNLTEKAKEIGINTKIKCWPQQPNTLVRHLNRLKVNLEAVGIDYQHYGHTRKGSLISLARRDGKEILPSRLPSPQNSSNHEDFGGCDDGDGFAPILSKKTIKHNGDEGEVI